jgi:hypothetical protein
MKKSIKITNEKLKHILGADWKNFEEKILPNCFCGRCGGETTIVDWEAELNDLNDIVLRGKCEKCGGMVNRYLEIRGRMRNLEKGAMTAVPTRVPTAVPTFDQVPACFSLLYGWLGVE